MNVTTKCTGRSLDEVGQRFVTRIPQGYLSHILDCDSKRQSEAQPKLLGNPMEDKITSQILRYCS